MNFKIFLWIQICKLSLKGNKGNKTKNKALRYTFKIQVEIICFKLELALKIAWNKFENWVEKLS